MNPSLQSVSPLQPVESSIHRYWPLHEWIDSTAIIGVSGGPDSVALLHALRSISGGRARLVVAHVDHGLRGAESDEDREWVKELSHAWGLPCEIAKLPQDPDQPAYASEESLRKARHRQLKGIAERYGAQWVVTGHHADDVVETMLHRLLRGTGPRGLASIAPRRPIAPGLSLVHPLLASSRVHVSEYLTTNQLGYRIDTTNTSDAYLRNRIRHRLLPYLREFIGIPLLDQRLWSAAQQIRDEHSLVEHASRTWLAASVHRVQADGVEFACESFVNTAWVVVREGLVQLWHDRRWPLQRMASKHWGQLSCFLQPEVPIQHPRRMQLPGKIEVTMRRGRVRFTRSEPSSD